MSKLTDYKGDVIVEVMVLWALDERTDAMVETYRSRANYDAALFSTLSTDRVSALVIQRVEPDPSIPTVETLTGFKTDTRKIYDPERNSFDLGPINTHDLQTLIDYAKPQGSDDHRNPLKVDITFKVRAVFDAILEAWTATGSTTLANRPDTDPILGLLGRKTTGKRVTYTYVEQQHRLSTSGVLVSHAIDTSGSVPSVRLAVLLDNLSPESQRLLASASWSSLSEFPATADTVTATVPIGLANAFKDVCRWILCNVSAKRGRQRLDAIVTSTQSIGDETKLVIAAREEIDKHLIVANHWQGTREDPNSKDPIERYQSVMSDVFGGLYKKYSLASPVNLIRGLVTTGDLGLGVFKKNDDLVGAWLQAGVGHCGEHATVGYEVLKAVAKGNPGGVIQKVYLAGNANIDHAFVLVNLKVDMLFKTRVLNVKQKIHSVGTEIYVLDLEVALAISNGDPPVLDAYLQYERFKAKTSKLLASLKNKKSSVFETPFVRYYDGYPTKPPLNDRTGDPDKLLRADFPNI